MTEVFNLNAPLGFYVVNACFHGSIAQEMETAAYEQLKIQKIACLGVYQVSGAYELPLIVQTLLSKPQSLGAIVLGYIERGETLHGQIMGQCVEQSLLQLSLTYKKPVGMGLIGPGASLEQAMLRAKPYAVSAVKAAIASAQIMKQIEMPVNDCEMKG